MNNYIGVKLVQAEKAFKLKTNVNKIVTLSDAALFEIPKDAEEGYKVVYPDGYVSWSPKEVFEKSYMQVVHNPKLTNSDVSISQEMVDNFIKETHVSTIGEKTTLVRAVLVNGYEIIEASACVDPANYSEKMGAEICLEKIKDKVWMLLGFLLQTAVGGVK